MANKILHKRSSVPERAPQLADLSYGELAINFADHKLYFKSSTNEIECLNTWANLVNKPVGLDATATADNTANAIAKRDANGNFSVSAPTANAHVATKQYVDEATPTLSWGAITGVLADQTDLNTALGLRQLTSAKNAANGYAGLDANAKINPAQLPAIAITDTFVVASQAAMLALTAETGDVAVRTDLNKSFILQGTTASTLAHWQELLTPTDAVTSVNGSTGAVSLTYTNVGAAAASHAHAISDVTGLQTALDGKAATSTTVTAGNGLTGGGSLAADRTVTLGTPATLTTTTTNSVTTDSHTHAVTFPVTSVAGKTGAVTLAKADVGLSNVDNTADASKSVSSAATLTTARTISLTGDVTGSVSFNGSANVSITTVVGDDSHNHTIANVDGLQTALDGKSATSHTHATYVTTDTTQTVSGAKTFSSQVVIPNGTASAPGIRFSSDASTGLYRSTTNTLAVTTNGTQAATFDPTGNFIAIGNVTAYSDIRLKTNIETISDAVAKVQAIRGVTFDRTDSARRQTGVIAQEVRAVLPEAVIEDTDSMLSVAYGNMVGLLVEAIKEQQMQINTLTAKINALESK